MDAQVKAAQTWLNATYGQKTGWVIVAEDGLPGWSTVYALRRALQVELGVSPISSGFGSATTAAFKQKVGKIDEATQSTNLLKILNFALWCKGYPAIWDGTPVTSYAGMSRAVLAVRIDIGLPSATSFVDVKLMASLLSMDAYVSLRNGSSQVRTIQQWLNATYFSRQDFDLVPADGVYSRTVQTALLYGLQYEIGMADGTANGNFGPGTRDGIKAYATVTLGSTDSSKRFVRLFQASLRFNGYDAPFSGTFNSDTVTAVKTFQRFLELPVTGDGDYRTWCALLVSSGDTTVSTKGFDTRWQLTPAEAKSAVSAGYTAVGRYLLGTGKFITSQELDGLKSSGLKLIPIHQRSNNSASVMTYANGILHAREATERGRVLGLPKNSIIFFCVDFDALGETIDGPILEYFRGVNDGLAASISTSYIPGVYGTRNVCTAVISAGHATAAFVAGMSTGFSGNMGFTMPSAWHYNQIAEISANFASSRSLSIDKDVVSSNAKPVSLASVTSPPVEQEQSPTATGFDAFFEWVVRAEVAIEAALRDASTPLQELKFYSAFSPDYVTHYLQKPKYWTPVQNYWVGYTPVIDTGSNAPLARAAAEAGMQGMDPQVPASLRDWQHFSATYRGYTSWGIPSASNNYGYGDIGGWALDLLQAWGKYRRSLTTGGTSNIYDFMLSELNQAHPVETFGGDDAVSDADAYLLAKRMAGYSGLLSDKMREVFKLSSAARISLFYSERFARSSDNVVSCYLKLVNGVEVGPFENVWFTKEPLLNAANADRLPTPDEATQCARAYAAFMASK